MSKLDMLEIYLYLLGSIKFSVLKKNPKQKPAYFIFFRQDLKKNVGFFFLSCEYCFV